MQMFFVWMEVGDDGESWSVKIGEQVPESCYANFGYHDKLDSARIFAASIRRAIRCGLKLH